MKFVCLFEHMKLYYLLFIPDYHQADSPSQHLHPDPLGHEGEAKEEAEAATKLSHQGSPGQTF